MTANLDRDGPKALLRRPDLRTLLAAVNAPGEETRIVGGAVRDALLGLPVGEIDLATTATPDLTLQRAKAAGLKAIPTGADHGTITVLVGSRPFEVTTLREDVETDGRRAVVRFGLDFEADARRRDFTINALSLGADGRLHDPVGGLSDLECRRVRFIGDPDARIREDFLRILRFFRFHAAYGEGPLDRAGREAAIRERAGLAQLSRERVGAELRKLLVARRAGEILSVMAADGFLGSILGGVVELGRLERVAAIDEASGSPNPLLRLAALAIAGVEDAGRLRDRLRLSNAEHASLEDFARVLARLKSVPEALDDAAVRRLAAEFGVPALLGTLAAVAGEPRPQIAAAGLVALRRFADGDERPPILPVRGADLLARGVPKGPEIGALLTEARAAWLAAGCPAGASLDMLLPKLEGRLAQPTPEANLQRGGVPLAAKTSPAR